VAVADLALTICVHLIGRVCRRRLRELLLQRCKASGVQFRAGEVARIQNVDDNAECVTLTLSDRTAVRSRQGQLNITWHPVPWCAAPISSRSSSVPLHGIICLKHRPSRALLPAIFGMTEN